MEMHDSNPQVDALREKISLVRKWDRFVVDHVQVIYILYRKDHQLSIVSMGCFGSDDGVVCETYSLNTWFLSHFVYSWVVSFESPSGFPVSSCDVSGCWSWIGCLWWWYSRASYTWCNGVSPFHSSCSGIQVLVLLILNDLYIGRKVCRPLFCVSSWPSFLSWTFLYSGRF